MLKTTILIAGTALVSGTIASALTANIILRLVGSQAISDRISEKVTEFLLKGDLTDRESARRSRRPMTYNHYKF